MDASPLARLAPELRNQIYTAVFTDDDDDRAVALHSSSSSSASPQHPLTRTCRRLRTESLGLFYRLTRFNAHLYDGPVTPLARWFAAIGPPACVLLREVRVWDLRMLRVTVRGKAANEMGGDDHEDDQPDEDDVNEDDDDDDDQCDEIRSLVRQALQQLGLRVTRLAATSTLIVAPARDAPRDRRPSCRG